MKLKSRHKTESMWIALAAALSCGFLAAQPSDAQELWVADDFTNTIYQIELDGTLISSFPEVKGAASGIALDPVDGSLWGVDENPPRLVNFTRTGELIVEVPGGNFGALAPEGMDFDSDGSIWVVEDTTSGMESRVYHVTREGVLIDSFPTSIASADITSPQAIAFDPTDGTLWVTDNSSDAIYNFTTSGALLAVLPVDLFDPTASNLQGIDVDDSDGSLWATDRNSMIYNLSRSGQLISAFSSTSYDLLSLNPSAVVFDGPVDLRDEIAALEAELRSLGGLDEHFEKAADKLEKALDDENWDTDNRPSDKKGKKVFDEMKKAAKELLKVKGSGEATALDAVDELVAIAAQLAQDAIDEAIAGGGKQKEIDKAFDELDKALEELAKGKPDKAIDKYKKAWEKARKALD